MTETHTQLYIQLVFAVKHKQCLIAETYRDEFEKYICEVIQNKNCKPLAICCMPDHAHILVELNPVVSISDLATDVKSHSTLWVNEKRLTADKFEWQDGFGAFGYSLLSLDNVVNYILNQPALHTGMSFKNEFIQLLEANDIEYRKEDLFDWIE